MRNDAGYAAGNLAVQTTLSFLPDLRPMVAAGLIEGVIGLQRRIEGPDVTGRRVLAVEDTSTTGSSVMAAVDALREAGAEVVGVAVIVDRGAGDAVRGAGLDYRAAYSLADLGLG